MLTQLDIKDFTIAENISLNFKSGLNVLTGETGAGKSIILGAISLIIGNKAKKEVVRKGCEKAVISAIFDISYLKNVKEFLEKNDMTLDDNEECIIRRVIRQNGNNRCFINDNSVSLPKLKELGEMLVEIHGQHQHQLLSKEKKQLELIDNFLGLKETKNNVASLYKIWKEKIKETEKITASFEENNNKFQLLSYQLKELEDLNLQEEEFNELSEEEQRLSSASEVLSVCEEAKDLLFDNEVTNVLEIINKTIQNFESLGIENGLQDIFSLLNEAKINIEETKGSINEFSCHYEINPERLLEVTNRLDMINKISDKMMTFPEELINLKENVKKEIEELNYSEDAVKIAKKQEEEAFEEYIEAAILLSQERTSNISKMEKAVNTETSKLKLADDLLQIKFFKNYKLIDEMSINDYSPTGIDKIDFYIRPNLGQDYQSMKNIASGGELSRLSLALQVVSLKNEKIPTMIFDEVDTGLSGETGNVVGEMLKSLGSLGQIMCVTHLPQVAAQGHNHYRVSKKTVKKDEGMVTLSRINHLDVSEREREIARMIGGDMVSTESLNNARQMINHFNS